MKTLKKHCGTLRAKRVQAVHKALKKGGYWSALRLYEVTKYPNPAEAVSALRANGIPIEKRPVPGTRHCEWRIARRAA